MMPTIAHLTTVHPRSDTRIFIKQAQTIARHFPHDVVLVVADGLGDEDKGVVGVRVHDLGRLSPRRLRRSLGGIWRAIGALRRMRPAVVHFHDPELLPAGFVLKALGMRVVYDVHEDMPQVALDRDWVPALIRHPTAWTLRTLEWLAARCFDLVVTATPKIAERFRRSNAILVQNFPILSELVSSDPTPQATRARAFAYVGVIAESRCAREMIEAMNILGDPLVRLELGGGFSPEDLGSALQSMPGWDAVNYHGPMTRPEMARLFADVRAGLVLFQPKRNHIAAQPNKMFEYMSAGLPVIAADFPLWREIIGTVCCGLLVDPTEPEAIAAAMRWILDHPEEAAAMGERGRLAVQRRYNWQNESGKLTAAYETLLEFDGKQAALRQSHEH